MVQLSANPNREQQRVRSKWDQREAVLTVLGVIGLLIGLVQLVPLVLPKTDDLVRHLSIGVVVLMVILLIVAFFFGKTTQAKHEEHLRLRMISKWRRLSRSEQRFMDAEKALGFWSAAPKEEQRGATRAMRCAVRWARVVSFWMRLSADRFDDDWLRFQRIRNEYLSETGRVREPVYETNGVIFRSKFNRRIGYFLHMDLVAPPVDEEGLWPDLSPTIQARIRLEMAQRNIDPFMRYFKEREREAQDDEGRDPIADGLARIGDRISEVARSAEKLRRIRDGEEGF